MKKCWRQCSMQSNARLLRMQPSNIQLWLKQQYWLTLDILSLVMPISYHSTKNKHWVDIQVSDKFLQHDLQQLHLLKFLMHLHDVRHLDKEVNYVELHQNDPILNQLREMCGEICVNSFELNKSNQVEIW